MQYPVAYVIKLISVFLEIHILKKNVFFPNNRINWFFFVVVVVVIYSIFSFLFLCITTNA